MTTLDGAQRKYLRGLAHGLKPVVQIGRQGLTETLLRNLDEALEHHELIKVKFQDFKDQKRALADEIDERLGSERVGLIGHTAIFYRPASDPDERRIRVPKRSPG